MLLIQKTENNIIKTEMSGVQFSSNYDIVVAGLGTAGAIAAVRAGKDGLKVLGIETLNCMGGLGTIGGVNSYYFGGKGGYYETIDEKVREIKPDVCKDGPAVCAFAKEYILDEEAKRFLLDISYESRITGVYTDENKIKGIQWLSPDGVKNTSCKFIIDATGDAHVCDILGCETEYGREFDKKMQPYTSVKGYCLNGSLKNTNHDSGNINQLEAESLSRGIISAHADWLNDDYSAEQLLYLAPLIGIREGRRIVGEEMPALEDFFNQTIDNRIIFYAIADLDKHGYDNSLETESFQDWFVAANLCAVNVCIPIPLGSIIPKGYDGILVAGRCLSVKRELAASVRMERDMQKCGEAAAVTAYLAIKNNCRANEVDYNSLKAVLSETGCYNEGNNIGYHFAYPSNSITEKINWYKEPCQIKDGLSSIKPGIAIWSANLLKDKITRNLIRWLDSDNENLKKHSAIALALQKNRLSLPVIRQMITDRDSVMLSDCRKKNQIRLHIAIYLAGKMRDSEIVDELIKIVIDEHEIDLPIYHNPDIIAKGHLVKGYNNTYFQSFSHSVSALMKIAEEYPTLRKKIYEGLTVAVNDKKYIRRITSQPDYTYEYTMAENIHDIVCRKTKSI